MKQKTKRRSYKNAIAIGIASFTSIALISTGLAAFVIIQNAQQTVSGNITVGQVVDGSVKLNIENITDPNIRLEPREQDKSGRVQYSGNAGEGERLAVNIKGTVEVGEGKKYSDNLDFYFIVNIKNNGSADNEGFKAHYVNTNRLSFKGFTNLAATTIEESKQDMSNKLQRVSDTEASFEFEFGFSWGTNYHSVNPADYYDGDGSGVSDENVITELKALRGPNSGTEENPIYPNYTYEITFHAKNIN